LRTGNSNKKSTIDLTTKNKIKEIKKFVLKKDIIDKNTKTKFVKKTK
tara:strand:- start:42 stop:182 length:141 start_codon:yes stop_codon:yes gene_type:complete